ncbi:MAG TPA: hypothetical protein VN667_05105 [Burkholderiales bacterium]|nr:hypothetical protein [Burkholderiales bacterium]
MANSASVENPDDLLLWPDGFWCFREEFSESWLRERDYRVIPLNCDEWVRITSEPAH